MTTRTVSPSAATGARRRTQAALSIAGLLTIIALWWAAGDSTRFLPGIGEVASPLPAFLTNPLVWQEVSITLGRVVGSLAIAFVVGIGCAVAMVRMPFWGRAVGAYVAIATAVPSTITALMALFIFRKSDAGVVFVVVATTFPFIAVLLREGLQATSASLDEMRTVYRIKGIQAFRHVFVPQVAPYALTALRNEYSHAWKVVVLAELFIINSGMGWQFSQAFDRFQLITVMHWLLLFVAILLATEYLIIRPVEQRAIRWKEQS